MSNPTDTNQASELYELCKKVYELTKWKDTLGYIQPFGQNVHFPDWFDDTITEDHDIAPLYTSDYLLERLPRFIIQPKNVPYWLTVSTMPTINGAAYVDGFGHRLYTCRSDTPLKALLKLTIALSEAGELK